MKKITILDNVTEMGFYNIDSSDSIFKSHDSDLTIYCYKDSMAMKYAVKYKIKYVLLTKQNNNNGQKQEETKKEESDPTIAKYKKLPQTGVSIAIIGTILLILIGGIALLAKYKTYKNVK